MYARCVETATKILENPEHPRYRDYHFKQAGLSPQAAAIMVDLIACNIAAVGESSGGFQADRREANEAALIEVAKTLAASPITSETLCQAAIRMQTIHAFKDGNHRSAMFMYYYLHVVYLKQFPKFEPHELYGYLTVYKFFQGRHMNNSAQMGEALAKRLFTDTRTEPIEENIAGESKTDTVVLHMAESKELSDLDIKLIMLEKKMQILSEHLRQLAALSDAFQRLESNQPKSIAEKKRARPKFMQSNLQTPLYDVVTSPDSELSATATSSKQRPIFLFDSREIMAAAAQHDASKAVSAQKAIKARLEKAGEGNIALVFDNQGKFSLMYYSNSRSDSSPIKILREADMGTQLKNEVSSYITGGKGKQKAQENIIAFVSKNGAWSTRAAKSARIFDPVTEYNLPKKIDSSPLVDEGLSIAIKRASKKLLHSKDGVAIVIDKDNQLNLMYVDYDPEHLTLNKSPIKMLKMSSMSHDLRVAVEAYVAEPTDSNKEKILSHIKPVSVIDNPLVQTMEWTEARRTRNKDESALWPMSLEKGLRLFDQPRKVDRVHIQLKDESVKEVKKQLREEGGIALVFDRDQQFRLIYAEYDPNLHKRISDPSSLPIKTLSPNEISNELLKLIRAYLNNPQDRQLESNVRIKILEEVKSKNLDKLELPSPGELLSRKFRK